MKILKITIPEYNIEQSPDFSAIGSKLDDVVKENFPDTWLAVRAVSSHDHPQDTLSCLVEKIKEIGTDRYDPHRKGVHDDLDKKFGIDTHAVPMMHSDKIVCPHYNTECSKADSAIGALLSDFHTGAIEDRGYSLRIDILLLYDLDQLMPVPIDWTGKSSIHLDKPVCPHSASTFRFKNPSDKKRALLGIILIGK